MLNFDPSDLTLGEMEDFEEVAGMSAQDIFRYRRRVEDGDGNPILDDDGNEQFSFHLPAKVLVAMAWIARRRDDPDFTLDDARQLKVNTLFTDDEEEQQNEDEPAEELVDAGS